MESLNYRELSYPQYCGKLYTNGLEGTLQKEKDNPVLLAQGAFEDNRSRGKAISSIARTKVDNFEALTVLLHREIKHNEKTEDTEREKEIVSMELSAGEIDAATFYAESWWLD